MSDQDRPACETCGRTLNVLGFCAACDAGGPPAHPAAAAGPAGATRAVTGAGRKPRAGAGRAGGASKGAVSIPPEPATQSVPSPPASELPPQQPTAVLATDEGFERKLRRYKEANTPAAVFIGFRAAGKTWLLRRYMNWLKDYVDFCGRIDGAGQLIPIDPTDEKDDRFSIPGSTAFEFYDVVPQDSRYCLIDTPGEYTQRLTQGRVSGISQLVAALDYASAVVIALPADVVLFGPAIRRLSAREIDMLIERTFAVRTASPEALRQLRQWVANIRFDAGLVRKFADGLGLAAGTLSYVRRNQIDCLDGDAFTGQIELESIIEHLGTPGAFTPVGGVSGLACPAFFALTKSDRIVAALFGDEPFKGLASELNALKHELMEMPETRFLHELAKHRGFIDKTKYPLEQPADFVRKVDPLLYSRLMRFFPMGRFDFVTAFFGHDYTDMLSADHYLAHPAHGVEHMHEWLRDARQLAARGDRRMSHHNLARQLYRFINAVPSGRGDLFGPV